MGVVYPQCEACGAKIPESHAHIDEDGFIGCRPCFPVSNRPEDGNRFLRGKCFRPRDPSIRDTPNGQ